MNTIETPNGYMLYAQSEKENPVIVAIMDLLETNDVPEEIYNNHGCIEHKGTSLNFAEIPKEKGINK